MHLFSDRGTPYSYRHMHGYSGHTYKFTQPDGTFNYIQIHLRTDQGTKTFTNEEAAKMASENPDFHTQDLFDSIANEDFPSWTCYVQVLSPEQAEKFHWNIFDLTKVWPQKEVPLREFGKFTLNKNRSPSRLHIWFLVSSHRPTQSYNRVSSHTLILTAIVWE
jgi:catalase